MEGTTQKHIYQIHIKECAQSVLTMLASDTSISDKVYQRYKETLSVSIIEYYKTTGLVKESSKDDVFKMSIVDVNWNILILVATNCMSIRIWMNI